ncbi:hypothetical protein ACFXKK_01660 [Streptomyces globisporus]|uniref:hypothetical protein n=1 Tax=Streptomyces globisporus TaxID=1908 RepID=UPI0036684354
MYQGDAAVDWMVVSVFAHDLCLPVYDRGYLYNGTPPQNYDVAASRCRNAYVGSDAHSDPAAMYGAARESFCRGLAAGGFGARCR